MSHSTFLLNLHSQVILQNFVLRFYRGVFGVLTTNSAEQIACPMSIRRTQARKTSESHPIFWIHTFCLVKKKIISENFQWNR